MDCEPAGVVQSYVICFALLTHEFAFYRELGTDGGEWDMVRKDGDATVFISPALAVHHARVNRLPKFVVAVQGA